MNSATISFHIEGSILSKYLHALGGSSWELVLEGRCSQDALAVAKDLIDFNSFHRQNGMIIASLFIHKSFLTNASDAQLMEIIGNLPDLQELLLSSVDISAEVLVHLLRQAAGVKKIRFDRIVIHCRQGEQHNRTDDFCAAVSKLVALEDFHMTLGSGAALALQRTNQTVRLFAGGEGSDNLDPLMRALSSIQILRSVYLGSDRRIHHTAMDPTTLASLSSSLEDMTLRNIGLSPNHCSCFYSPSLQSLNLIQAGLGDEGALILAEKIRHHSRLCSLKKLHLAHNEITDIGGVAIVQALEGHPILRSNLEFLAMNGCLLAATTGQALSKWLGSPDCGLSHLDLSGNVRLGEPGGVALASALVKNTRLHQLVLFGCSLGDETCEAFASTLSVQRSLTVLNLYGNDFIDYRGMLALTECLEHHNCILERLAILAKESKGLEKKLDFFLRLNRDFHRGDLLQQSTTDQKFVVDGLAKASSQDDASTLFYFLSARPALCRSHSSTPSPLNTKASFTSAVFQFASGLGSTRKAKMWCNPQA